MLETFDPSPIDGIDYVKFSTDYYSKPYVRNLLREFGSDGVVVTQALDSYIQRHGCSIKWNDDDERDFRFMFVPHIPHKKIKDIVERLLKKGHYDAEKFKSLEILTSDEIQLSYLIIKSSKGCLEPIDEKIICKKAKKFMDKLLNGEKNAEKGTGNSVSKTRKKKAETVSDLKHQDEKNASSRVRAPQEEKRRVKKSIVENINYSSTNNNLKEEEEEENACAKNF